MYVAWSAVLVWVNTGLPAAVIGGVEVDPPPHWPVQPGVVGATDTLLDTLPAEMTVPETVYVAVAPAGRLTEPATVLPALPVVVQVPAPGAEQVTLTEPTLAGTVSAMFAVPEPVP